MTIFDADAELTRRMDETRRLGIGTRVATALELRQAVEDFDLEPMSLSSVEELKRRVRAVADVLAPPPGPVRVPARLVMSVRPDRYPSGTTMRQAPEGTAQRVLDARNEALAGRELK